MIGAIFRAAERFGQPIVSGLTVLEWPWTWHRIAANLKRLEGIYTRAAALNVDPPPKHLLFDPKEVEAYFEAVKEDSDGHPD